MLIRVSDYASYGLDESDPSLPRKLAGIESRIREATRNNFHVRVVHVEGASAGGALHVSSPYWRVGDTIHVTYPESNVGLYVIDSIEEGHVTFDQPLFDESLNRSTLVRYPQDVIEGAVGMLDYDKRMASKAGISSESLSRRSVSYQQPSEDSLYKGYPAGVTGFMRPYVRARC